MERKYKSVELEPDKAKTFKGYLREMHIKYESSEADNLIHFEVLVNDRETKEINKFLDFCLKGEINEKRNVQQMAFN